MKFIHAADIHLDSVYSGLKSFYGDKALSISEASQRAFVRLIDFALEESVDFLIIAGDLFDRNWKDYQQGLFMVEQIKRFDKPIFYIRGNHDAENRLLKKIPYPSNFIEFSSKSAETHTLEDLNVALHGQSFPSVKVDSDLSLKYPKPLNDYFNIGLLHSSGEIGGGEKPYSPFVLKDLCNKGYQYWALGHIHHHHLLSKDPPVVYSGILQGRHMKETNSKGCCLVEVNDNSKARITFKELSDIVFLKIPLDISALKKEHELKSKVLAALKEQVRIYPKTHRFVVRFILSGCCCLSPSFQEDLPHYQHALHCWLNDEESDKFYLERLENFTTLNRSYEEIAKDNVFFQELENKLKKELAHESTHEKYLQSLKYLFESAPLNYKRHPFWAELEEKERFESLMRKIKINLTEKLVDHTP